MRRISSESTAAIPPDARRAFWSAWPRSIFLYLAGQGLIPDPVYNPPQPSQTPRRQCSPCRRAALARPSIQAACPACQSDRSFQIRDWPSRAPRPLIHRQYARQSADESVCADQVRACPGYTRFERICPDAPLLHQFALNERRDERRHPAFPHIYINRYIVGIADHEIPEEGIEQKFLRVFQIRHHLNQDVGVVDKMLICSHGSLS